MALQTLAQALQEQHEAAVIRQAEMIRDWRAGPERTKQAETYVRSVLWEQSIGRVGQATQYRVYSILSFVMPADAAIQGEPLPVARLESEADWERAYHEQLEQRSCPECGDGMCPVEEPRFSSQSR
jgi:hypothetical protein